jgi:hypothetical protein
MTPQPVAVTQDTKNANRVHAHGSACTLVEATQDTLTLRRVRVTIAAVGKK